MGVPVLTPAAMRAVEQDWFAAGNDSFALMERAAHAVASAALAQARGGPVLVVCGPGNNGGDGWLAASLLRENGVDVSVAAVTPPEALRGDAARAAQRWGEPSHARVEPGLAAAHGVVVDALFGIGLSRSPVGDAAAAIHAINGVGVPVVAVDVPSGVDASTGEAPGEAVRATETIAFHALKPGMCCNPDGRFAAA
jgi:NAD(P)H-hydrate epimerase